MRRHILLLILLCLCGLARGQTEGYSCYFWFDGQQGKPQTATVMQGSFDVDVTVLPEGIHTFHCLVIENDTAVSSPIVRYFMKSPKADTTIKGYYWFDEETNVREVTIYNGTFEVDASSLSDGLHQFHYQALQTDGTTSLPTSSYFLKTAQALTDEEFTCLCTVDGNLVHQETLPANGGAIHWNLDMNDIAEGLHKIQIEVLLSNGALSGCQQSFFVKVPNADITTNTTGFYWFDEESYIHESPVTNGTFEVDASSLSDGFHKFYYQASQANGVTSLPTTSYFLKTAQVNPNDALTCICSVDGQLRYVEKLSQQGGVIHWDLDMQDLADGVHKIQLQAVTQSGALSSTYTSYFMRVASYEDLSEMYCVYAIDGSSLNNRSNVISQHGSFHFDLDLSELEEGLHYISFILHNDRGSSTKAQTRFFVKTPAGGNGIKQYQYWQNEDSLEQAKTVTLPEKVNPLQLMTLLPVESRPLRSSLFHFDTSSGKPMVYAMNTIRLRFYDAAMRFNDVAKDYADYSVSKEVEPVGTLQSSQTFEKVAEDGIRWYTFQAATGDTTAFRLSQPATVQVFAPSGAEVFKTSESASIQWSGIHTWEDGTYYLAVHDVTGSQSTMKLEYMHMDKYDVVDWDVHTVGNGGCSTITFKGNGFRNLYAVDLVIVPGDSVHSVFVSHDSDAETEIAFDFTGATLGEYNAIFHFTEEDKHVASVVIVEEAVDIELATEVSFPSSFLRGTSTTYTIKITNKGNMTAYNVPLTIKISNSSNNDISHVALEGLGLKKLFDHIEDFDGWSQMEIESFKNQSDEVGEAHYFVKLKGANETGDSIFIRTGLFGLSIPPNTTKTSNLTLTSSEDVEVWIAAAKEVEPLTPETFTKQSSNKSPRQKTGWFCCHYEQLVCIGNIIVSVADIGSLAIGTGVDKISATISCVTGLINENLTQWGNVFCNKEEVEKSLKDKLYTVFHGMNIMGTIISCAGKFLGDYKKINELTQLIMGAIDVSFLDAANWPCIESFTKTIPGCPCIDDDCGGGGPSTPYTPSDPNDIYGYLSETGSKFIADSVARVNYTIEFENDTTFATAAAHTIIIKDTLDSRYFDLTKFMPTGIRIGEHETFLDEADVVIKNDKITFVKTIDMRHEINAIAQVDGEYNQKNGIATWTFTSLDPMTMEPTDDLMQGILPVNYNGTSGIGEVMFEVGMKQGKADGTEIMNRAGIVFDYEEAILTPTWTNIVDAVPPTSTIGDLEILNDTIIRVNVNGFDERSGVWKYELYVQHGQNAPWWKEGETDSTYFDFRFYEDIDYGFCVLATDSAGNVEKKELQRERKFNSNDEEFEDIIEGLPKSTADNKDEYDLSGRKVGRKEQRVVIRNRKKVLSK